MSVLELTRPFFIDDSIYEEYCNFYDFYKDAIDNIIKDHLVDEGIDEEDQMWSNLVHEYKIIDIDGQYVKFIDHYSGVAGNYWEEMAKDIVIISQENLHIKEIIL